MRTEVGRAIVFVFMAIVVSSEVRGAAVADNWAQWRGPGSQGVSSESNLPTAWSTTKNIKWKLPIAGRGHSSPIVWENRVFVTTSIEGPAIPGAQAVKHIINQQEVRLPDTVGADHSYTLKLFCIGVESGNVLWEKTVYEGRMFDDRQRRNTYASSTPVTDGRYVYAFFGAEGLYCYDFDGKLVWKIPLAGLAKMGYGEGTSPVLFENLVILQLDSELGEKSYISAFDKTTGKEVWKTSRKNRATWSTPILVKTKKRVELIASGAESVIAYDPATGKELWRSDGLVSHAIPTPLAGDDMVFVYAGSHDKKGYAVRLGGSGDISKSDQILWRYHKGTAYVASGVLYDGNVYVLTDGGILTCLDARTGEVKYEGGRVPVSTTFFASPVAFDGKILLTSEDGDTFVIKAGQKHELLETNHVGEPVYASPAISNGKIFIRGEQSLFCIGT
jgi:outer membrane protein assembly factor BamB